MEPVLPVLDPGPRLRFSVGRYILGDFIRA